MERRIKVCLPSTVRLVRASLPRGTDQVSLLIARRREAHARRQPGVNMYDDALEKEKKKGKKLANFFCFDYFQNGDLLASLFTFDAPT